MLGIVESRSITIHKDWDYIMMELSHVHDVHAWEARLGHFFQIRKDFVTSRYAKVNDVVDLQNNGATDINHVLNRNRYPSRFLMLYLCSRLKRR